MSGREKGMIGDGGTARLWSDKRTDVIEHREINARKNVRLFVWVYVSGL